MKRGAAGSRPNGTGAPESSGQTIRYFPVWPSDLLAFLARTGEHPSVTGARLRLWCVACSSDRPDPVGYLPDDDGRLARWSGLSTEEWAAAKPEIVGSWALEGGRYLIRRIIEAGNWCDKRAESARIAGQESARRRGGSQPRVNGRFAKTETTELPNDGPNDRSGGRSVNHLTTDRTTVRADVRFSPNDSPNTPLHSTPLHIQSEEEEEVFRNSELLEKGGAHHNGVADPASAATSSAQSAVGSRPDPGTGALVRGLWIEAHTRAGRKPPRYISTADDKAAERIQATLLAQFTVTEVREGFSAIAAEYLRASKSATPTIAKLEPDLEHWWQRTEGGA